MKSFIRKFLYSWRYYSLGEATYRKCMKRVFVGNLASLRHINIVVAILASCFSLFPIVIENDISKAVVYLITAAVSIVIEMIARYKRKGSVSDRLIYTLTTVYYINVIFFGIYLGVLTNPDNYAALFIGFIISALLVFIFSPLLILSFSTVALIAFAISSFLVKPPTHYPFDIANAVIAYFLGLAFNWLLAKYKLAATLNISELEEEVIEKNEYNHFLFENAPVGLTVFDGNFNYIDCNEAVLRIFGVSREFYSQFFGSADHSPEYQPDGTRSLDKAKEIIKRIMAGEDMKFEWVHQTADGEPLPVELTMTRMKRGDQYVGLGYLYDMREQIRLKKEIETALMKTQEAGRIKSEFLSRMSHEMRTPMNAVIGLTQIAKSTIDPKKRLQYFSKIEVASHELMSLIDDVLNVSDMDFGTFKITESIFNIHAMLQEIITMISHNSAAKKQKFTYEIDPSIPASLIGNEERLRQVIVNLMGNAIKFTPESGEISLSVRKMEHNNKKLSLQFDISDNGIGIPKDKQEYVFDLFYQADGSKTREHGGIGIGLALSKRIVEMMNGEIHFESEPGKGSKFTFTCHLKVPSADEVVHLASPPADTGDIVETLPDFSGKHILVVDDLAFNRGIVRNLLKTTGIQITEAASGKEAVRLFCESPNDFHLILMDIMMPIMNGLEAAQEIRESGVANAESVPIIALTAPGDKDMETAKSVGIDSHITDLKESALIVLLKQYLG